MGTHVLIKNLHSRLFNILLEFTPRNLKDLENICGIAMDIASRQDEYRTKGVEFSAVMLTQNPAGRLSYDIVQAVKILRDNGFPFSIEIVPHITCKDYNVDSLEVEINALLDLGIETALALTGDKPREAKGVFQIDSLGLLLLINKINARIAQRAHSPEELRKVPQLVAGAAISPFKYSEPSLIMQYIKAEKKVRCGARFLISQAGWDTDKSEELARKRNALDVPIIGNVMALDYPTAYITKDLPGCVLTDEFLEKLKDEKPDDMLNRAAQQVAMFKSLGYAGVDISNVTTVDQITHIVDAALEIKNWRDFKRNISFPPPFTPSTRLTKSPRGMNLLHKLAFEKQGKLFNVSKWLLSPVERSFQRNYGLLYRLFFGMEHLIKGAIFDCRQCGDCYLPENYFVCTVGGCNKGLPNPPCGDATVEGFCGNDPKRPCAAELILYRALLKKDLSELRRTIFGSRDIALDGTSSILNYFFGRDHAMHESLEERSGLKQIAEMVHASIPSVAPSIFYLKELGEEGFKHHNRGLNAVIDLIGSQASCRPSFIDVNIDALGGNTPSMMRHFVQLVKQHGKGIPVCIDSSNPEVLKAGLEEWYKDDASLPAPLLNSINYAELERMQPILSMRRSYDFNIIGLLTGTQGVLKSAEEMYEAARTIFKQALSCGFQPQQIFFDTVTLGISFDSPIDEMGMPKPSHTHNSFHAIRHIMTDPEMKGVNSVLGVSNWTHDIKKRRIGHNRAFIAVAQRYGLNSIIIDVRNEYGIKPAAPELMDLVEMFVSLDGSEDSVLTYNAMIREMRKKGWV